MCCSFLYVVADTDTSVSFSVCCSFLCVVADTDTSVSFSVCCSFPCVVADTDTFVSFSAHQCLAAERLQCACAINESWLRSIQDSYRL